MTPLKLVDQSGDILGAVIVPDVSLISLLRERVLTFYWCPPVGVFAINKPMEAIDTHIIKFVPAYGRDDAVMLIEWTIYDFEKIIGCFFIPGYAFTMKGRR